MNSSTINLIVAPYCEHPVQPECRIAMWLWKVFPPILILLGTCGNILNIVVLSRKRLRAHSTSMYLLFLAVSDFTFIWVSMSRQVTLRVSGYDIMNLSLFNCVVHSWLTFAVGGLSMWILVPLTIERTIVTVWPVQSRGKVTRRKAIIACTTLLVMNAAFAGVLLFSYDMKTISREVITSNGTTEIKETSRICLPRSTAINAFVLREWRQMCFIFYNLLPILIISTSNAIIATKLALQKRTRVHPDSSSTVTAFQGKRNAATRMVLVLSSFFLTMTLPFCAFNVVKSTMFRNVSDTKTKAKLQLAHAITFMLLYFNYSFNFWLYFVSGAMFKNEWTRIVESARTKYNEFIRRLRRRSVRGTTIEVLPRTTSFVAPEVFSLKTITRSEGNI